MSATDAAVQEVGLRPITERIVNDFAIQVATVNGSGSQTANLVLLRSIFQMGVPVSGKNMFPSNIAGLPTWYTIRASAKGYIGRKKEVDFLVAMNPETAREDVLTLAPGAGADRVPRGQPRNVRREHVLAGYRHTHLEDRPQKHEIRGLAARSVDGGDLDGEIVDDALCGWA